MVYGGVSAYDKFYCTCNELDARSCTNLALLILDLEIQKKCTKSNRNNVNLEFDKPVTLLILVPHFAYLPVLCQLFLQTYTVNQNPRKN